MLALNPNALKDARALDSERKSGKLRGPLHGIPIIVKDNIETRDPMATTAGSYALAKSFRPADAPLAARLRAAGAIILGKANLSEWANFRSTRSCSGWSGIGGQVRNAYDPARNPSGSSAGSGVAAAASFCAAAIGTETNGSILSPSSINGLVGLKPTVGVVSGKGVVPISPRQDTAGPMCRTVGDAAILAAVIAERPLGFGAHGNDIEAFRLRGVRIGVMPVPQGAHPDTNRLFADARAVLEQEGAVTVDLKPPRAFDETGEAQLDGLLFEFKDAINAYLATLDPSQVDCRTLADLIAFNQGSCRRRTHRFWPGDLRNGGGERTLERSGLSEGTGHPEAHHATWKGWRRCWGSRAWRCWWARATDRPISSIRSGAIGAAADHRKSPAPRRSPVIPASQCPRGW